MRCLLLLAACAQEELGGLGGDDAVTQRGLNAGVLAAAGVAGHEEAERSEAWFVAEGAGGRGDPGALQGVAEDEPRRRLRLVAQAHGDVVEALLPALVGDDEDARVPVHARRQERVRLADDGGAGAEALDQRPLSAKGGARAQRDPVSAVGEIERVLDGFVAAAEEQRVARGERRAPGGEVEGVEDALVPRARREERGRAQGAEAGGEDQSAGGDDRAGLDADPPALTRLPVGVGRLTVEEGPDSGLGEDLRGVAAAELGEGLTRVPQDPVLLKLQPLEAGTEAVGALDERDREPELGEPGGC